MWRISKSEVCTVTSEALSSKVWPKVELESSRHAKPRAGAPLWSKTSSGSADLELNLERELRFGAKPRAGALIWSQTSSGSAFEVQNLERERIRSVDWAEQTASSDFVDFADEVGDSLAQPTF